MRADVLQDGRQLRVVMVCDSPDPSGVGEHMLTLAQALGARCEVSFVFADAAGAAPFAARARAAGHAVDQLAGDAPGWRPESLARRLRPFSPELVHIHAGVGWEGVNAGLAAQWAGARAAVRTEHLPYVLKHPVQRRQHAAELARVDRVICVSQASLRSYGDAGLPLSRFRMVRNGVAARPPRRSRAATRRALEFAEHEPLLLTVARLTPQKGHRDLLRAAPAILARRRDAGFLWVGEGALRPALEAEVAAAGLSGRISMPGARDDVPDLLAAADVFILPSLFEGLPLALLEAMDAGLPVVATAAPGVAEVLAGGGGHLTPPRDPAALAEAVLALLADRQAARRLGEEGRTAVRGAFAATRMAEETLAVYREALALAEASAALPERRSA